MNNILVVCKRNTSPQKALYKCFLMLHYNTETSVTTEIIPQASQSISTIDIHRARSTDSLAARTTEGQGRVNFVLDLDQGIEHHRPTSIQINLVSLHMWLVARLIRILKMQAATLTTQCRCTVVKITLHHWQLYILQNI